jgi:hypothetical protein
VSGLLVILDEKSTEREDLKHAKALPECQSDAAIDKEMFRGEEDIVV